MNGAGVLLVMLLLLLAWWWGWHAGRADGVTRERARRARADVAASMLARGDDWRWR